MEQYEVRTVDLVKKYKMGKETIGALNGVTLNIQKGGLVSITGKSGSGKSTLLHLIGGLDKPTSGKIYLADKDITSVKEKQLSDIRRDQIGFVFQKFCLIQELSVYENIVIPALLKGASYDKEYLETIIQRLDLADRLTHMPSELSGGEQQRTAIARALINKPKLVLCDEPTGNLDSKTSKNVIDLLIRLHEELKLTLVIVTHDIGIANMGNERIYIEDGKTIVEHS